MRKDQSDGAQIRVAENAQPASDGRERAGEALALLASYLEAAQLELQVFLLVQELLQAVREDNVGVVQAAVLLVELVVLVVFHARGHTVVSRHVHILLLLLLVATIAGCGVSIRLLLLLHHPK